MRLLLLLNGVAPVAVGLAGALLASTALLQPSRRLRGFWPRPQKTSENYLTGDRRNQQGS